MHPPKPKLLTMQSALCTCDEAADLANTTPQVILDWIASGVLRTVGRGRELRVAVINLRDYCTWYGGWPDGMEPRGYIYLIYWNGYYKIGKATNVAQRMQGITSSHPIPPDVIHVIPTTAMTTLEALLHKRFAAKRVSGEWFALNEEDVAAIQECKAYVPSRL